MYFNPKYILACLPFFLCTNTYASWPLESGNTVTTTQARAIANELVHRGMLTVAPSGAVINEVSLKGTYSLNYRNYLDKLDLTELYVKFSTMTFAGGVIKLSVSATFSNGDCNRPTITYAAASGSSGLLDVAIKRYFSEQSLQFVRDNLIRQTILAKYCN